MKRAKLETILSTAIACALTACQTSPTPTAEKWLPKSTASDLTIETDEKEESKKYTKELMSLTQTAMKQTQQAVADYEANDKESALTKINNAVLTIKQIERINEEFHKRFPNEMTGEEKNVAMLGLQMMKDNILQIQSRIQTEITLTETKQEEKSQSKANPDRNTSPFHSAPAEKPKTRPAKTVNFNQLLDQTEKVAKLCIAMERMVKRKLSLEEKTRNDTIRELESLKKMFEEFKKQHPLLTRSKLEQELVSTVPRTINRVEESLNAFKSAPVANSPPQSESVDGFEQTAKTPPDLVTATPDSWLLKLSGIMKSASDSHGAAHQAYRYNRYQAALNHVENALYETNRLKDQYKECIRQLPQMKQQLEKKGFTIRTIEKVEQTMIQSKANIQARIKNCN